MKKVLLVLAAVVLVLVGGVVVYTYPRHVAETLAGVQYRVVQGHARRVIPVRVTLDGTLRRSIFGNLTFRGTVGIKGATRPNSNNTRQLTMQFTDGMGIITYAYFTQGQPMVNTYGAMFINGGVSKLTILEGSWTTVNGLTISAPASTRSQAVAMSNLLMKKFMHGFVIR